MVTPRLLLVGFSSKVLQVGDIVVLWSPFQSVRQFCLSNRNDAHGAVLPVEWGGGGPESLESRYRLCTATNYI